MAAPQPRSLVQRHALLAFFGLTFALGIALSVAVTQTARAG